MDSSSVNAAASSAEKEYLFTAMPVNRAVISLAVPTVISQIITVVYNMADTFFIGRMNDPNQVAAATISMPLFIFMTALANLFGIGGASLISRSLGIGNRKKAASCSSFCIWTAAGAALLYGIAILFLRPCLLPVIGADSKTWNMHRCSAHGSEPRTCAPHPFGRLFETGKPRGCFRRYSEHFARPVIYLCF